MAEQNEIEVRVARIREKAAVIFEDPEKAEHWMRARNRVLEAAPIDLLDSDEGAEMVETVLHRIEHGVFS
ncbi:MbcA/ParS/Xre antitoxin family protein [Thioalkalivibrio sp. ALJ16]|uniref:MbcA/ParS/Xre antitoxin family protein n=1 Tax=Thioalkalivibrio sp. ALJ16 TaxID=1158762 RepID=UPI000362B387|nr:MbcA/ParS/Xre antitoxin family protein [Thioalkalivibrio sp. ALJ16]